MTISNKKHNNELLQRIANHLIINSSFLENLGLFHGKMGIVIFFYHYSRYANNPIYEEFAEELLDEIFEEIHDKLPIDFENGYLGIGWGIEYLAEQKFIYGNTNDILEDIDKKVMERDIRRISDISLNTGLEGVLHYALARLQNNKNMGRVFDNQYFDDLKEVMKSIDRENTSKSLTSLLNNYLLWTTLEQSDYSQKNYFADFYSGEIFDNNRVYEWKLGLINGCAGMGLKIIHK